MRKEQREIKDFDKIKGIISSCQTVRLGLFGGEYPYIVPLSYGFKADGERLTVYFHCATEGKKADLMAADNRVCLEWDILHGYVDTGKSVTADYESVMAFGHVEKCSGEEKTEGIRLLLEHTGYPARSAEQCAALPIVAVYKVTCEQVTGKRRFNN